MADKTFDERMLRPNLQISSKKYKINPSTLLCREGDILVTKKAVENIAVKLLQLATTELPHEVKEALRRAYSEEESEVGKSQLKAILKNVELAEKMQKPLCQDTGVVIFYVKAGGQVKGLGQIEEALRNATVKATREVPLRPNAVDPFTQKITEDNTGRLIPYIHWEVVPGDTLEITVMPKGGGSENVSALGMLSPSQGIKGLKKFVIDTVINAGAKPCPPTILGVAIGGGADIAMKLAKAALLKPLNQPSLSPELAKLEKELCEAANQTGIGPMGLGGKITVLGVKVDYAYRHPASYPVAVAVQCWAARMASARIYPDGKVEYLSHKVM
jgi:fumarate hydratase subunit alpha